MPKKSKMQYLTVIFNWAFNLYINTQINVKFEVQNSHYV